MDAMSDDPELYKAMILDKSLNGTDTNIAAVVHHMLKNDFVYVNKERGSRWYHFDDHRWTMCPKSCELRIKLSTEVFDEYCTQASKMNEMVRVSVDYEQQQRYLEMAQKYTKIALSLKNSSAKDRIVKECREFFNVNENWVENLDSNMIGDFIREYFDVTGVQTDKIVAMKLHEDFRSTHRENRMTYNKFKEHMAINGFRVVQCNTRGEFRKKMVFEGLVPIPV